MIIANNISALFDERQLRIQNQEKEKAMRKLSSGYRINQAADDAAGLGISEKMRAMIRGLDQAERNSQEGISLIQVGEGALGEVHAMLDRLTELADQSANGTYLDADREMMQDELDQICDEIRRIAETTNFNTIKLFQNEGYEYERTGTAPSRTDISSTAAGTVGKIQTVNSRTLENLIANTAADEINIVYVERVDDQVSTTQDKTGGNTLSGNDFQIGNKMLSEILQEEIIPNTIDNILTNYPAFSYLAGSSIGIGLKYEQTYNASGTTLASVTCGAGGSYTVDSSGKITSRTDMLSYQLTVNVHPNVISRSATRADLSDLEATIAHEMIHAFMDEATTVGMLGRMESATKTSLGSVQTVTGFPKWFVEGMAQTASGPGNWLEKGNNNRLEIDTSSDNAAIQAAITKYPLDATATASQYGTGYLACMYLGAVIAGNGTLGSKVDASTIASGLTKLMNSVISGNSLDQAIERLTIVNGKAKFSTTADFVNKFNTFNTTSTNLPEIGQFVHDLLTETGSGLGGIVSGDLKATDLTPDNTNTGSNINLFKLDTTHDTVKNTYPNSPQSYKVYSGGATSVSGTAPGFATSSTTVDYGDFLINGATNQVKGVSWDSATQTLTIDDGVPATISLKSGVSQTSGKILVRGSGDVTLNNLTAGVLTVEPGTGGGTGRTIIYNGVNKLGGVELKSGAEATFRGTNRGRLETGAFNSDNTNTVTFEQGAVVVGAGSIPAVTKIKIDNASVTAGLTSPQVNSASSPQQLSGIDLPWNKLQTLQDVVSVSFGNTVSGMTIPKGQTATLWLANNNTTHKIKVTDSAGVSRTLMAKWDNGVFKWLEPPEPFTITKVGGGAPQKGTDYDYLDDGRLVIMTSDNYSISSVKGSFGDWGNVTGSIQIADNTGAVGITLNNVECALTEGCAFDLGTGNQVTLTLPKDTTNRFVSASNHAGIRLGDKTALTIQEESGGTGTTVGQLEAIGGSNGAGIGCSNGAANAALKSTITIEGGNITASGGAVQRNILTGDVKTGSGSAGAGIGAALHAGFGDITIKGGRVTASGGSGGAGIGGAKYARVGNITVTKEAPATIRAQSSEHGAGIGGGWYAANGDIHISGGVISAESKSHGTGIGAGCLADQSNEKMEIRIDGNAHITWAKGGDNAAGIGASQSGYCGNIIISDKAQIDWAEGGTNGAGIGSGSGSHAGTITINTTYTTGTTGTTGAITAKGGANGVGIGSGYKNSEIGEITITGGTISARGGENSTGIGAGRDSKSANITIGDATGAQKVVLTAQGGMTYNGGNILSFADPAHKNAGTVKIQGFNTSVRPGGPGEGLYSTSGVTDASGPLYAYPLYLFQEPGSPIGGATLEAGVDLGTNGLMPLDSLTAKYTDMDPQGTFSKIKITSSLGPTWAEGLTHDPLDENYVFLWLQPKNQKLTVDFEYTDINGAPQSGIAELDLIYYDNAGVFRVAQQKKPEDAKVPGHTDDPQDPGQDPKPDPDLENKGNGIILQIGAREGQTLEIPRFYFSLEALKMEKLDISTQENAWAAIPVVRNAKGRVSEIRGAYGAYQNRLEHTIKNLGQSSENLSAAESRIRDADMAKEMVKFSVHSIITQVGQSLLAQDMKRPEQVVQLLQE